YLGFARAKAGIAIEAPPPGDEAQCRRNRQKPDHDEGGYLAPESMIGEVVLRALRPEIYPEDADHDDQPGNHAVEAVERAQAPDLVRADSRPHGGDLDSQDRGKREDEKMMDDGEQEIGEHHASRRPAEGRRPSRAKAL